MKSPLATSEAVDIALLKYLHIILNRLIDYLVRKKDSYLFL